MEIDEKTLEIIQKACKKMAKKYAFINYSEEDIEQEAFIMCANALEKYNGSIPLEHFLLVHLSNRLKNLKRDKANARHAAFLYAVPIDSVSQQNDCFLTEDNIIEDIAESDLRKKIDKNLPAEYREEYLMMINGINIPTARKTKIRKIISEILSW